MKKLTLSCLSAPLGGQLNGDADFTGVFTDTRSPVNGGLFVALEGERFDGHKFLDAAAEGGAAAAIVKTGAQCALPHICVEDTKKALLSLGKYYRSLFDLRLIALTGSVGKTTTKEMTYEVIKRKYKAIKTQGNLNNDIGMPLTLFSIEEDTQAAVIEMGMNHSGELTLLSDAAAPTTAVITNVGVSHIENLGSRENILKAKLEILTGLGRGADVIMCADNDLLGRVRLKEHNAVFFGIRSKGCFAAAQDIKSDERGSECRFVCDYGSERVFIPAAGEHNIYNALAAFTAGVRNGVSTAQAADAISCYTPSGMRQKVVKKEGITFIEDCYNASPDSVTAGINALLCMKGKRSIAVLGDMLELGDFSRRAHEKCGEYAFESGVDALFTYGELSKNTARAARDAGMTSVFSFEDKTDLSDALARYIEKGDAVLFKASRGMRLEQVIESVYGKL